MVLVSNTRLGLGLEGILKSLSCLEIKVLVLKKSLEYITAGKTVGGAKYLQSRCP